MTKELNTIQNQILDLVSMHSMAINAHPFHDVAKSKEQLKEHFLSELKKQKKELESKRKIAYLGPQGTFSHQITKEIFGSAADLVPFKSIEDVFTEVSKGHISNGVVPVENSINGSVVQTTDMLLKNNVTIRAEAILDVNLCFMSNAKKEDIDTIYSHPQPIGQSWQWIKENYPNADLIETSSTTKAVKIASQEKTSAAIANKLASECYSIEILEEKIQDNPVNKTRFFVIGEEIEDVKGGYKTSISATLSNKAGELFRLLQAFDKENINLTKIESRPSRTQEWNYNFLIDFEGNHKEKNIERVIKNLNTNELTISILGSYRQAI